MKPQALAFLLSVAALLLVPVAALRGAWPWTGLWAALAVAAWGATRVWNQRDPIPFPHWAWWVLLALPRGRQSARDLLDVLQPGPDDRILEVGSGPGLHALPVARALEPGGQLTAIDIQPEMLVHLERRAAVAGLTTIRTRRADAEGLPFSDGTFDKAYMIGTLGEIADGDRALRELRRVLKPGGRLVIGELLPDPDFIRRAVLHRRARTAGFSLERVTGSSWSYLAVFRTGSG